MSILSFRRRTGRPAPRHSVHGPRELTPAQAAAHADAVHGRDSAADMIAALRASGQDPYPEPEVMTAGSAGWAGAQDAAYEMAADETTLISTVQPRSYVAARCLLPAIPLEAEIRLWVRAKIAAGAYEDVDLYADQAERRVQTRSDRAHWHARQTLADGWRQITALAAAAGRAA